jgi:predicted phage-related endonuclease
VADLWASKVFELEPLSKAQLTVGTYLERSLIDWSENEGGLGKILRNQYRRVEGVPIAVNIDGICQQGGRAGDPVECKTAGIVSDFSPTDEWGEPGTGEVPASTICQCHGHMMAQKRNVCWVPALIGGAGGFRLYRVERQPELVAAIRKLAPLFWDRYVKTETPPGPEWAEDCAPTLATLKRIVRTPEKAVEFDARQAKLVNTWIDWRRTSTIVGHAKDAAWAAVLAEFGDAEAATLPDGRQVTYLEQASGRLQTKEIKAAHPEIAAQFKAPDVRVARIKKGPK